MSVALPSADVVLAAVRTALVLLLIGAYRVARVAVALVGLSHWLGAPLACALVLTAALMRATVLLQLGAALTLLLWWHWPVLLALLAVAPRLLAILPGLIRTAGASVRHPRPRWSPPARVEGAVLSVRTDHGFNG